MTHKILLADDSLTIQKVVELTFSDSDYELVCVSNGQKALDRIRDDRPDVVLADVVMPEKNGYEVCEAIKSNPATARIPVVLLSGTFEPFDRERAERIGADAIVSKPFDSQQLIAQVEALLDRRAHAADADTDGQTTAKIPSLGAIAAAAEPEEGPFDVGFSAEDFTAAVRLPQRGLDPFEEEYGRGDVDSAIKAFEKSQPQAAAAAEPAEHPAAPEPKASEGLPAGQAAPRWLGDDSEKSFAADVSAEDAETFAGVVLDTQSTVAIRRSTLTDPLVEEEGRTTETPTHPLDWNRPSAETAEPDLPTQKISLSEVAFAPAAPPAAVSEAEDEESAAGGELAAAAPSPSHRGAAAATEAVVSEASAAGPVPREIELLAKSSSIPELTQMLSKVARQAAGDLTDDQMETLARRVVEKLSDRIVREIAWEVIPDMAEIVIKKRIKELEGGAE